MKAKRKLDAYTLRKYARMVRRWQASEEKHAVLPDGTTDIYYRGRSGVLCALARRLEADLRAMVRESNPPTKRGRNRKGHD